jgi:hypothetical protein
VTERELLATTSEILIRRGGDFQATSTVCSGPNTNPWRSQATDRAVEEGDLVWTDTDAVVFGGSFLCVSRTFVVGEPSEEQRRLFGDALAWLREMEGFVKPGMTCGEIAERGPRVPERVLAQRYEVMIHGLGLEEESPSVAYPGDLQPNPDRVIEPNMVLAIELYAGEPGARDGAKLGDVVVVTEDGVRVVAPYPFSEALGGLLPVIGRVSRSAIARSASRSASRTASSGVVARTMVSTGTPAFESSHVPSPTIGLPILSASAISESVPNSPWIAITASAVRTTTAFLASPIPVATATVR